MARAKKKKKKKKLESIIPTDKQATFDLGDLVIGIYIGKRKSKHKVCKNLQFKRYRSVKDDDYCSYDDDEVDDRATIEYWSLSYKNRGRTQEIGHWEIYVPHNGIACVNHSGINDDTFKGVGLGKLCYGKLASAYRVLESDPGGCTSDEAARVWLALKAQKIEGGRRFRLIRGRR